MKFKIKGNKHIILIIFSIIVMILAICILTMGVSVNHDYYQYMDLDGNTGIAKECSYRVYGYKAGGQGSPICELEDGTIKQVKEYKKYYTSKGE